MTIKQKNKDNRDNIINTTHKKEVRVKSKGDFSAGHSLGVLPNSLDTVLVWHVCGINCVLAS